MSEMSVIPVNTADAYEVVIGREILVAEAAKVLEGAQKVLVVHQPSLTTVAEELKRQIETDSLQLFLAEVPDAEAAKRVEVAQFLWQIGRAHV